MKPILLLTLMYALSAWGQAEDVAGVVQRTIPYRANYIVWADNEYVLFSGRDLRGRTGDAHRPGGVYRWRSRSGEVEQLFRIDSAVDLLCYDRGYIHIEFWRGEDRVVVRGPMGSETTITYKRVEKRPFEGVFNDVTCRYQQAPIPTSSGRHVVTTLREEHGVLEYEPPLPGTRVYRGKYFLARPDGESIPLLGLHDISWAPQYSEFRRAYVFQYAGGDLSDSADKSTWFVEPNGRLTEFKLPKGHWLGGSIRTMPVRDGVVIASPALRAELRGLYLVQPGTARQIVRGYVGAFAVAPDGCRVALTQSERFGSQAKAQVLLVETYMGG